MIAMNVALEDVYKKVFADSYQHGAPLGVKRPWDFDRMNRDQLIDILIEEGMNAFFIRYALTGCVLA